MKNTLFHLPLFGVGLVISLWNYYVGSLTIAGPVLGSGAAIARNRESQDWSSVDAAESFHALRRNSSHEKFRRRTKQNEGKASTLDGKAASMRQAKEYIVPANVTAVQLQRCSNSSHLCCYVTVGQPAQKLMLLLDTGSTNLHVVSSDCQTGYTGPKFNPNLSHAYEPVPLVDTVKFVSVTLTSQIGRDTVCLGKLCIEGQHIAVVKKWKSNENKDIFKQLSFDGVLGLGLPGLATLGSHTLVENVEATGNIDSFSIYCSEKSKAKTPMALILGKPKFPLYQGKMTEAPTANDKYWSLELESIYLGSEKVCCSTPSHLVLDSGTPTNTLPQRVYDLLPPIINQSRDMPNLIYRLKHGAVITITPNMYSRVTDNEFKRVLHFTPLDFKAEGVTTYVLGIIPFFSHFFVTFHLATQPGKNRSIGFALADHSDKAQVYVQSLLTNSNDSVIH